MGRKFSSGRLDIGPGEVLDLEQERLAGEVRKGICETIAQIQPRRMIPPAETPPSAPGGLRLLHRDGRKFSSGRLDKRIELLARRRTASALEHHRRLK